MSRTRVGAPAVAVGLAGLLTGNELGTLAAVHPAMARLPMPALLLAEQELTHPLPGAAQHAACGGRAESVPETRHRTAPVPQAIADREASKRGLAAGRMTSTLDSRETLPTPSFTSRHGAACDSPPYGQR
jgi:hypothetical protein